MQNKRKFTGIILNLFDGSGAGAAQGGAEGGGDGETTSSVDRATVQRAKELNISDDLMEDYAKAFGNKAERGTGQSTEETTNNEETEEAEDLDAEFDALVKGKFKDVYHKRTENFVKDRTSKANRDRAELEAKAAKSDNVMNLLAEKYGTSDPDALLEAIRGDNEMWRQKAIDAGQTAEEFIESYDQKQSAAAQQQELESLRQYKAANELNMRLQTLASETQKVYPDFSLEAEFNNPKFRAALDMIAQQNEEQNKATGTSNEVFDLTFAYEMAHADELRSNTIRRTAKAAQNAMAQTMQAQRQRPAENAARQTVPARAKSYRDYTDEEFAEKLERVKRGMDKI